jgi:hypothetical protein
MYPPLLSHEVSNTIFTSDPFDIDHVVNSSLILSIEVTSETKKKQKNTVSYSASGVAISERRALTSLHGCIPLGHPVTMMTRNGKKLYGRIEFEKFESNMVDIAVILLDSPSEFIYYMEFADEPVKVLQEIVVVGLKYGSVGDMINHYARKSSVDSIEELGPHSALFQAQYYSFDGCSGGGVITVASSSSAKVVGVHVASHEDSSKRPKKRKITSFANFEADVESVIHGHNSYSLVCEIARVPEVVNLLKTV